MFTENFSDFSIVRNGVEVTIQFSKLNPVIWKAQFALDTAVMNSMTPFMPLQTGSLRQRTIAESMARAGTGTVVAGAPPYGRYQYFGKVMVDSVTGKGPMKIPNVGLRFHKGATLVATDRPLKYSQPNARPFWFEEAKAKDLQKWIDTVKKVVGDNLNG